MSSEEDENYVTVTVKARGRECSLYCRTAVVVTAMADNIPGPACHIGDLDRDALPVLADRAVSELLSFGIGAGVPEDRMRIELVHAATSCGYTEEEERDAIRYNLDIDADESAKEEKDEWGRPDDQDNGRVQGVPPRAGGKVRHGRGDAR